MMKKRNSTLTYEQHENLQRNIDSDVIWNGVFFLNYLEGFHFSAQFQIIVHILLYFNLMVCLL